MNRIYVRLFWLGLAVLLAVSLIPDISVNRNAFTARTGIRADYVLHFLGYAMTAWFYGKAYPVSARSVALLLLFAVASEVIQYFVGGRVVQTADIACNAVGMASGLLLAVLTTRRIRPSP